MHAFSAFFWTILLEQNYGYNYQGVRQWGLIPQDAKDHLEGERKRQIPRQQKNAVMQVRRSRLHHHPEAKAGEDPGLRLRTVPSM